MRKFRANIVVAFWFSSKNLGSLKWDNWMWSQEWLWVTRKQHTCECDNKNLKSCGSFHYLFNGYDITDVRFKVELTTAFWNVGFTCSWLRKYKSHASAWIQVLRVWLTVSSSLGHLLTSCFLFNLTQWLSAQVSSSLLWLPCKCVAFLCLSFCFSCLLYVVFW